MDFKKLIVIGLIVGIIAFLVGSVLYMNPWVAEIYAQHADWPGNQSMDAFGGVINWLFLMMAGGMVSTVFLAFLYHYTEKGIKLSPVWKKGLFFGFLYWLVSTLPQIYNTWLLYSRAVFILQLELVFGLIGSLVAGVLLAILYKKWQ